MRLFVALCVVAVLSGCVSATLPITSNNALPVHGSKWKTNNYRVPSDNTSVLLLIRDTGFRGSACIPEISLNGEDVAPIGIGEKLELHLNAGRYLLRASPNFNCAATVAEIFVDISEGNTSSYRLSFVNREMFLTPATY